MVLGANSMVVPGANGDHFMTQLIKSIIIITMPSLLPCYAQYENFRFYLLASAAGQDTKLV
jgi:hypothetical protein